MKIYVDPIPKTLSQAMYRVSTALREHLPCEIAETPEDADLQILHTIGHLAERHLRNDNYAIIQYCSRSKTADQSSLVDLTPWEPLWEKAKVVWSYYDIPSELEKDHWLNDKFYLAPMGVPKLFLEPFPVEMERDYGVMTSGYVSGPGAEAIEEVAIAAHKLSMNVLHLGPHPKGMHFFPPRWSSVLNVTDEQLSMYYHRCLWVSGLRHIEGFELPIIEGLMCGARPIAFDRPETRRWFDKHAYLIPECHGKELVEHLMLFMKNPPVAVTDAEREIVARKFNWETIVRGFWGKLTEVNFQ